MDLERARGEGGGGRWAVRRGGGSGVNGKLYEEKKKRDWRKKKNAIGLSLWRR